MPVSPFIVDVTQDDFQTQVVEASAQVPVLVDFWAEWCGPCKILMPVLTQLAQRYAGQFILAKVNIDAQSDLANRFAVRSVPTVKLFRQGQVVDEFLGVQSETQIRTLLDRYIERASDKLASAAIARLKAGDPTQALSLLQQAFVDDPHNLRVVVTLAEVYMQLGDHEEAQTLLKGLPLKLANEPAISALLAQLSFISLAAKAPPLEVLEETLVQRPADSAARYQLSARYIARGEYEPALQQLLEIVRHDRAYDDDAGRKGLLKVFEILGGGDALVSRYRALMSAALY